MKNTKVSKSLTSAVLAFAMLLTPLAAMAQTRIAMPKNKYQIQDDIKLGQQASAEAERQLPILRDNYVTDYVGDVGRRLVAAIPQEYDHPEFRYTFKVVNARDINAFALPGGPMYVNRGMIEAAKTEGEMAGVMAHEISHVALRHATAQQTKVSSPGNTILGIGAILGGAILGGQTGAALGQVFVQGYFTRYSREYETQADVLGAQIMARAGYDPRDLANMFRTIEQQSGGSGTPEWLSSHPSPANRYQRINQEAALLRVSGSRPDSREFLSVKQRLSGMQRAQTMSEIERSGQRNPSSGSTGSTGAGYSRSVPTPSSRYRTYSGGPIRVSVPDNWQDYSNGDSVTLAPSGAYGDQGLTHGVLVSLAQTQSRNLQSASDEVLRSLLQGNSYLRQQSGYRRGTLDGRSALSTVLTGRSPITGQSETVTLYTTLLSDGSLMYVATVSPQADSSRYNRAFSDIISSLQINDR